MEDEESSNSDGSQLSVPPLKDTRHRATVRHSDYDYSLASDEDIDIPNPSKLRTNNISKSKEASSRAYTPLVPIEELEETVTKECCCDKNISMF